MKVDAEAALQVVDLIIAGGLATQHAQAVAQKTRDRFEVEINSARAAGLQEIPADRWAAMLDDAREAARNAIG